MNNYINLSYHLKDDFFNLVQDKHLMKNKENGNYRPHYFCFQDSDNPDIYWAIPQSTQVAKFRQIYNAKVKKYGLCNTIIFGKFSGRDNAFLIQNMFPIISKYIDHEHTVNGKPVNVHPKLAKEIVRNAKQVLILYKKGIKLIFPDIDNIYSIMEKELA